jgi:hypothetical protein
MVDRFHADSHVNSEDKDEIGRDLRREEWIVEKIIDKKVRVGQVFYLVKWLNYPDNNCTWEPEAKLVNLKEFVRDYEDDCRSGKSKNEERKNWKNKSRFFPPEGNLITDRPQDIEKVKLKENSLYVKISWCPRVSGITPRKSLFRYEEIRAKFPNLLIDFFEKQTTIGDKQMSKLVKK